MIEQIFIVEIFRAETKLFYWNLLIQLCKGFFQIFADKGISQTYRQPNEENNLFIWINLCNKLKEKSCSSLK